MNHSTYKLVIFLILLLLSGCGSDGNKAIITGAPDTPSGTENTPPTGNNNNSGGTSLNDWLIPANQVYDGGPGKDGIPAIDSPRFNSGWSNLTYLRDDGMVIIFRPSSDSGVRVYPHGILDWHEIVNDNLSAFAWSLTYCPLTGSAVIVDRSQINGSTFGVSGLLYNNNLIMYDRGTDSFWSQMLLKSVRGQFSGMLVNPLPYIETTKATAQKMFANPQILSTATGYSQPYGAYPYGSYKTSSSTLFPMPQFDSRLHPKERVLGILADGSSKAYQILGGGGFEVLNEQVGSQAVVVLRAPGDNLAVAYLRDNPMQGELSFNLDLSRTDVFPFNIKDDQTGSSWNFLGEAVDGPLIGTKLEPAKAMIAYWFAWAAFYPGTELY